MSTLRLAIERAGGPTAVAKRLGFSVQAVCFWRDGDRQMPVDYLATLEAMSGVRRWDIRPNDWHLIWPELIGAEGAPAAPDLAEAEVRDAA